MVFRPQINQYGIFKNPIESWPQEKKSGVDIFIRLIKFVAVLNGVKELGYGLNLPN
jgi:hypothetical protein